MLSLNILNAVLWTQSQLPGTEAVNSSGAGSPFTNYDAGVAAYMFFIGVLVTALFSAAFLIINLGLLSKRPEDRIGTRTPSDLGILKSNVWPEQPYQQWTLPAEEDNLKEEDYALAPPVSKEEEGLVGHQQPKKKAA